MDYHKAFIILYGAAALSLEQIEKACVLTPELANAIIILEDAITKVEDLPEKTDIQE